MAEYTQYEQGLIDVLRRLDAIERRFEASDRRFDDMDKRGQHNAEVLVRIDERTERQERDATRYVTKEEFAPIRAVVYGMVGTILVAVVSALLYLVVRKGP